MITKLTVDSERREWKKNFLVTYTDKGWDMVAYAFAFKYKEGLLMYYAVKKERLMLDINKSIDPTILIDYIAIGLPEVVLTH